MLPMVTMLHSAYDGNDVVAAARHRNRVMNASIPLHFVQQ
jgi:hypothetical protein